jgi:hypothetical protein
MLCLCNNVLCSANNEFTSTVIISLCHQPPAHRAPHRREQRKEQECKPEPCFFLIGSMRAQQNANLVFSRHCKHQEHREPCLREWSATTMRTSFWSVVVSLTRAKANLVFVQCHETRQNRLRTRTVFLLMV